MPQTDGSESNVNPVAQLAQQAVKILCEAYLRTYALQYALAQRGVVTQDEFDRAYRALMNHPPVREFLVRQGIDLGVVSNLDALLRSYEGPIQ